MRFFFLFSSVLSKRSIYVFFQLAICFGCIDIIYLPMLKRKQPNQKCSFFVLEKKESSLATSEYLGDLCNFLHGQTKFFVLIPTQLDNAHKNV